MTGKEKCKLLKQIRKEIAETNGIVYLTSECNIDGECDGTCPKCDAEIRYLDSEIQRLAQEGKAISLSGLKLSIIDSVINCGQNEAQRIEASGYDYLWDDWDEYEPSDRMFNAASVPRETPENIYEWTIEELDVSVRAYNCLKRAGIKTVADIVERGKDGLIGIRNMGVKQREEVIQKIEALGGEMKEDS